MEALVRRVLLFVCLYASLGASSRSANFVVTAPTKSLATDVCRTAEKCRRDLAIEWLGRELPRWSEPCPIVVEIASGAGGMTQFMFDQQRRPFGWRMKVQGPRIRILDSVIPHEVTHTIFATHFGQPLPRWADEGACTAVEHFSERSRHQEMLLQFLTTGEGIAFNRMFAMFEYPPNMLPLYSQGYSVARYLIERGGKRRFVRFVGEGLRSKDWTSATRNHYDVDSLGDLQGEWLSWVKQGSPSLAPTRGGENILVSSSSERSTRGETSPIRVAATDRRSTTSVRDRANRDESGGTSWYARQAKTASVPRTDRSALRAKIPRDSVLRFDGNLKANGTLYR